jgi:hypothetical protein
MRSRVWLTVVRASAIFAVLLLLALALRYRHRTREILREFWLTPTSPVNLAALRIALFYSLYGSARGQNFRFYAGMPESVRELPYGWGWLGAVPFDASLVSGASTAFVVASFAALVGFCSRVSVPVAALLAVYLLGLPNFFAKVNHAHHARVLCALAIAAAPCGDALSVDRVWRWLRGRPPSSPSVAYTLPVRFAWLLIATTYFFPGFWKLWKSGDQWFTGEALRFHLYSRWAARPDFEPLFRVDESDWLVALLGSATLLFELGFVVALFTRPTRVLAALAAVGFHLGVAHTMGIRFHVFFPLVLLLEPAEAWSTVRRHVPARLLALGAALRARLETLGRGPPRALEPAKSPFPIVATLVVGTALVLGQLGTGLARVNTWPVSVYPTFSSRVKRPPLVGKTARLALESPGGSPRNLEAKLKRFGPARRKALLRDLRKNMNRGPVRRRGRSTIDLFRHAGVSLEPGDSIVVYETTWKVLPPGERRDARERLVERYVVKRGDWLARER